jgi:hypothetical protein
MVRRWDFRHGQIGFEEWRLSHSMSEFKSWIEQGAPSDDATEGFSSQPRNQQYESAKGRP